MEISLNLLLVAILIGGWFFGKLFTNMGLPSVLGMIIWGIGISFFYKGSFPDVIWQISPFFKSLALIVILLRAGLGINRITLKKVGLPAILLPFIPCLLEGFTLLFLFHFIIGLIMLLPESALF